MKVSRNIIMYALIFGAVVGGIGTIGWFGHRTITRFITHQTVLQNTIAALQESLATQHTEIQTLKETLDGSLKHAEATNTKLSENIAEERKLREQSEKTLTSSLAAQSAKTNVAAIIREWRPRIAHVSCAWAGGNTSLGSGLLIGRIDGTYHIQTNKHVVYNQNTGSFPVGCSVRLPDDTPVQANTVHLRTNDSAVITIETPSTRMKQFASSILTKACRTKPDVGNQLVVLGYPVIGAPTDITATEGIVSGYEGNYYITSAKIEQGNSGGAAIAVAENCYMGIPTLTYVGRVESLGRILNWTALQLQ